jgi:transposase
MLNEAGSGQVYLACGATDMRKSIDGLAALVEYCFDLDPFSDAWFVFCNRGRNKLKLLRWDHNGFWLYYRRLEKGRFAWPSGSVREPMAVSRRELGWLLDGLTLEQRRAHRAVEARTIV